MNQLVHQLQATSCTHGEAVGADVVWAIFAMVGFPDGVYTIPDIVMAHEYPM